MSAHDAVAHDVGVDEVPLVVALEVPAAHGALAVVQVALGSCAGRFSMSEGSAGRDARESGGDETRLMCQHACMGQAARGGHVTHREGPLHCRLRCSRATRRVPTSRRSHAWSVRGARRQRRRRGPCWQRQAQRGQTLGRHGVRMWSKRAGLRGRARRVRKREHPAGLEPLPRTAKKR